MSALALISHVEWSRQQPPSFSPKEQTALASHAGNWLLTRQTAQRETVSFIPNTQTHKFKSSAPHLWEILPPPHPRRLFTRSQASQLEAERRIIVRLWFLCVRVCVKVSFHQVSGGRATSCSEESPSPQCEWQETQKEVFVPVRPHCFPMLFTWSPEAERLAFVCLGFTTVEKLTTLWREKTTRSTDSLLECHDSVASVYISKMPSTGWETVFGLSCSRFLKPSFLVFCNCNQSFVDRWPREKAATFIYPPPETHFLEPATNLNSSEGFQRIPYLLLEHLGKHFRIRNGRFWTPFVWSSLQR